MAEPTEPEFQLLDLSSRRQAGNIFKLASDPKYRKYIDGLGGQKLSLDELLQFKANYTIL